MPGEQTEHPTLISEEQPEPEPSTANVAIPVDAAVAANVLSESTAPQPERPGE